MYWEELPVETVAKETGINRVGTVYQHKSRFLSTLKKEFMTLLQEFNDSNELELDKISDKIFSESLAHVVNGRKDLKVTIVNQTLPESISLKLDYIKRHFPEKPPKENAYFILIRDNTKISEHIIAATCTIGRNKDADISLDDPDVSSVHCRIKKENCDYIIYDDNSTNGTFVNSKKLSTSHILKSGDIISISATTSLIFIN